MNAELVAAIIGLVTVVVSLLGSALIVSFRTGKLVRDIEILKASNLRTEQLYLDVGVMKTDLAEIKGMFRYTLRKEE
jgi:hypothetical protein